MRLTKHQLLKGFLQIFSVTLICAPLFVPGSAHAQFKLSGKTQGHCTLSNVNRGVVLYDGTCTIAESISVNKTRWKITVGNASAFTFVDKGGGYEFHGEDGTTEDARFKDRGHTGIFRWSHFRLVVDEFH